MESESAVNEATRRFMEEAEKLPLVPLRKYDWEGRKMQTWTWKRLLAVVVLSPLILLAAAYEGLSWAFTTATGWEADEW